MPNAVLIPFVVIIGLALIWLPIMMAAVMLSGWWDLARRYPATKPAIGAQRGVGSVFFSPLFRYKNFVLFAVDDDYLHLRLPPLLGALHAPISIPWPAIELPANQPTLPGMTPIVAIGRRIFVSKPMVEKEKQIRGLIDPEPGPEPTETIN